MALTALISFKGTFRRGMNTHTDSQSYIHSYVLTHNSHIRVLSPFLFLSVSLSLTSTIQITPASVVPSLLLTFPSRPLRRRVPCPESPRIRHWGKIATAPRVHAHCSSFELNELFANYSYIIILPTQIRRYHRPPTFADEAASLYPTEHRLWSSVNPSTLFVPGELVNCCY